MPTPFNSASRLHSLLVQTHNGTAKQRSLDVWCEVFGIDAEDQNLRWILVAERARLALGELARIDRWMEQSSLPVRRYQRALERLREVFDITAMTNQFSHYSRHINDYTLLALTTTVVVPSASFIRSSATRVVA